MIKNILQSIFNLICGICLIAQIILLYFFLEAVITSEKLFIIVLCYIVCEFILHYTDYSLTRIILSVFNKKK